MRSYRMVDFGVPLELFETATPEPTGTQVLLRVRAAGVCHSDLHIWEGSYDLGFGRRMSLKDRGIRVPLTLGHETVGEVVAAGVSSGAQPKTLRPPNSWERCRSSAISSGTVGPVACHSSLRACSSNRVRAPSSSSRA